MKKILTIIILFVFVCTKPVFALETTNTNKPQGLERKELNKKNRLILSGTIVSLTTDSLTLQVNKNELTGKTVIVNINTQTKLLRKFGGKSSLSEFTPNDEIQAAGKWTDDAKTILTANLIRNLSIQKRFGAFIGTIKNLGENSFVLQSKNRGEQKVIITDTTKIVNRKMQALKFSDLMPEHRVRVKGLWNNKNNTITEVVQIKDFDLPPKTTLTPTPTP
jgi:ribosomal protein L21E